MNRNTLFTVKNRQTAAILFCALVGIATLAQLTAFQIQTDFGAINAENTTITNETGIPIRGKLFKPKEASPRNPLPGIVFAHGYQSTRETGDAIAIELSRRGFVVFSIDTIGRGNSGRPIDDLNSPDFDKSFGTRAALYHVRSLPYVDSRRIGLVGHSLGAEMALNVAMENTWVRALVILGFAYTTSVTTTNPKNMLMIIGQYDEFRDRMTGTSDIRAEWMKTEQTARAIDHPNPELGVTYGDFESGSARRVVVPNVIHIYEPHSHLVIAETLRWMRDALSPPARLWRDPDKQTGIWKEWATLLAMIAAFFGILPLGFLLLGLGPFISLQQHGELKCICQGSAYWKHFLINGALMCLYPLFIIMIFGLHKYVVPLDGIFPMMVVNATVWWFMGINIIGFFLLRAWRRSQKLSWGELGFSFEPDAMVIDWIAMGKTFFVATLLFLYIIGLEYILEHLFNADFRFIFAFASDLTAHRFLLFLLYYPFLLIGFLQLGFFLHGQVRLAPKPTFSGTFLLWSITNLFTLVAPLIALLGVQYIPLLTSGTIPIVGPGGVFVLFWINLIHIVGVLILVVPISTGLFVFSGRPYLSAFLNAAIVSWMFTSSQVIAPIPV